MNLLNKRGVPWFREGIWLWSNMANADASDERRRWTDPRLRGSKRDRRRPKIHDLGPRVRGDRHPPQTGSEVRNCTPSNRVRCHTKSTSDHGSEVAGGGTRPRTTGPRCRVPECTTSDQVRGQGHHLGPRVRGSRPTDLHDLGLSPRSHDHLGPKVRDIGSEGCTTSDRFRGHRATSDRFRGRRLGQDLGVLRCIPVHFQGVLSVFFCVLSGSMYCQGFESVSGLLLPCFGSVSEGVQRYAVV